MKRTLRLRRETLAEITAGELAGVAGGQLLTEVSCPATECVPGDVILDVRTLPLDRCIGTPPTFPPRCNTGLGC